MRIWTAATLEVAGEVPGPLRELGVADHQTLTFDEGLPAQPWVVLRRDGAVLDARLRLERPPPSVAGEWGVSWEPEPEPDDNRGFTEAEQRVITASITAIKIQVAIALPPGPAAEISAALDDIDATSSRMGRSEWRKYVNGSLIDLGVRGVVTADHVQFVFNLLRAGIAQLTGLELPALQ